MPGRLEISVDARMIEHSGIGTVLRNVLPFLIAEDGFRVTVMGDRGKLSAFPWMEKAEFIPLGSAIYSLPEHLELARKIPPCDVFWSPHYNVPLLPIRARRRLVTIHDVFHLAHARAMSLPKRAYSRALMEGAVRLSHGIATVSEFSYREITERLDPDKRKLRVIPNGHDPEYARGVEPPAPSGDYLLFVGNVKPHKNVLGAMNAFLKICPRNPGLTLRIVGRKDGFITGDPRVAELAATLGGRILFTGFVSDAVVKQNYMGAKALLFPSFYEGFGLPILEAMSFGIPVLSSDRASMREVGGDAIRYFDPDDLESFVLAIEDTLEKRWVPDPGKYRSQLDKFNWRKCAGQYVEFLKTLS